MPRPSRRDFLKQSITFGAAALAAAPLGEALALAPAKPDATMKLGLCTYLWGQDWDLPTLLKNCERAKIFGVELRTGHRHSVEPGLSRQQRAGVKKVLADSPVKFVGPGTNECFDHVDAEKLDAAIEKTKAFVKLSKDLGGSGVKVKPNDFHKEVPREKTIAQIGKSLNIVGQFAAENGQQIRLEVHGSCSPLPVIKQIMDIAHHPAVGVCWNCNGDELEGRGLAYHLDLVKKRFGATVHVRELNDPKYPYQELIKLLVKMRYNGWILLECRGTPEDRVAALIEQRELFETMVEKART
jgi:sugar phosphate isomerase/epimerase